MRLNRERADPDTLLPSQAQAWPLPLSWGAWVDGRTGLGKGVSAPDWGGGQSTNLHPAQLMRNNDVSRAGTEGLQPQKILATFSACS